MDKVNATKNWFIIVGVPVLIGLGTWTLNSTIANREDAIEIKTIIAQRIPVNERRFATIENRLDKLEDKDKRSNAAFNE